MNIEGGSVVVRDFEAVACFSQSISRQLIIPVLGDVAEGHAIWLGVVGCWIEGRRREMPGFDDPAGKAA